MKMLVAVALIATSVPVIAGPGAANASGAQRERRFCATIQPRSQSHMPERRICKTAAEWREALGPDWRQNLTGVRNVEDSMSDIGLRSSRQSNPGIQPSAN